MKTPGSEEPGTRILTASDALSIPVIPLSSLLVRALLLKRTRSLALLDARKSRVYAQLFATEGAEPRALNEAVDLSLEEVLPEGNFWSIGEGAVRYKEEVLAAGGGVPLDADRSPALAAATYAARHPELRCAPSEIAMRYLRPPL